MPIKPDNLNWGLQRHAHESSELRQQYSLRDSDDQLSSLVISSYSPARSWSYKLLQYYEEPE